MKFYLPVGKLMLFTALLIALGAFFIYVEWFAPPHVLRAIGAKNLDKIAHIAAGVLLSLLYQGGSRRPRVIPLVLFVFVIAVGWEVIEFYADPKTVFFYRISPELWRLDTAGDITAGILGAYGYWVFGRKREEKQII